MLQLALSFLSLSCYGEGNWQNSCASGPIYVFSVLIWCLACFPVMTVMPLLMNQSWIWLLQCIYSTADIHFIVWVNVNLHNGMLLFSTCMICISLHFRWWADKVQYSFRQTFSWANEHVNCQGSVKCKPTSWIWYGYAPVPRRDIYAIPWKKANTCTYLYITIRSEICKWRQSKCQ